MSIHTIFRKIAGLLLICCPLAGSQVWAQSSTTASDLSWQTQITEENEPGQPLVVTGTVYRADGKTPAPGVLVDIYHTDAKGLYAPRSEPRGTIRIRGQVRTDKKGRYRFKTIKPGSYPSGDAPAHIHYTLTGAGISGKQFRELLFDGDTKLSHTTIKKERQRGKFSSIVTVTEDDEGVLYAEMNIRLTNGGE